jgi:hypothetical protein
MKKKPQVFEEAKRSAERTTEEDEMAGPLQLKITGAFAGAIGLMCASALTFSCPVYRSYAPEQA